MTYPLSTLSPTAVTDDTVPTWRKWQQQQADKQANQQQNAAAPYSDEANIGTAQTQSNIMGIVAGETDAANAGAAQIKQTKDAIATAARNAAILAQQQQAGKALGVAGQGASNALNTQYAQQAAAQQATAGTGNVMYTNNGTTQGPVQYSGQASQVAQMARNAGFPESAIPTVVAISQAESSGRADATHSNNNGSTDYGLMQINSIHSDLLKGKDPFDPQQNLNMAYQVYKDAGGSFTPWSTYNSGAVNKFMSMGQTAAKTAQSGGIVPANVAPFTVPTTDGLRVALVNKAQQYLGVPYVWGGTDLSKGVDCSGLVQSVYKQLGVNLPRTSYQMAAYGKRESISKLLPGDLVAWAHSNGVVHHIAIYMGNGQIIESPHTGASVRIRHLGTDESPIGVHLSGI